MGSAALGVFWFGELGCLPFPKGPCWTSCHPQQYLYILNDKFWKVMESPSFIKILLLPPSHLLLPLPAAKPFSSCSVYTSSLPLCCSSAYVHIFPGLPPHCCLSPHPCLSFTIGRAETMLAHSKEGIWKGQWPFLKHPLWKKERCSRRERKRGWAVWRKSKEGKHWWNNIQQPNSLPGHQIWKGFALQGQ